MSPPHIRITTDPVSETLCSPHYTILNDRQRKKKRNPECYIPSPVSFKFYFNYYNLLQCYWHRTGGKIVIFMLGIMAELTATLRILFPVMPHFLFCLYSEPSLSCQTYLCSVQPLMSAETSRCSEALAT
jgi:hypothetical protein